MMVVAVMAEAGAVAVMAVEATAVETVAAVTVVVGTAEGILGRLARWFI